MVNDISPRTPAEYEAQIHRLGAEVLRLNGELAAARRVIAGCALCRERDSLQQQERQKVAEERAGQQVEPRARRNAEHGEERQNEREQKDDEAK